jgi:hypothetical protein
MRGKFGSNSGVSRSLQLLELYPYILRSSTAHVLVTVELPNASLCHNLDYFDWWVLLEGYPSAVIIVVVAVVLFCSGVRCEVI